MNKQQFFAALKDKLIELPQDEIEEQMIFYGEMIDDRIEEGMTEEQAIAQLGTLESIVAQILAEIPRKKLVTERVTPSRKRSAWETVLLAAGAPIWLPLFASIYAVVWSVTISLWAIEFSLAACSAGGVFASVVFMARGNLASGAAMLGAGILCAGLGIFGFGGCKYATDAILKYSKNIFIWMKSCFWKKEKEA